MSVSIRQVRWESVPPRQQPGPAGGRDKESGSDDVAHPAGYYPASERPSAGGRGLRRPVTSKGPQNSEQDRIRLGHGVRR